jgi:hypothetical protein
MKRIAVPLVTLLLLTMVLVWPTSTALAAGGIIKVATPGVGLELKLNGKPTPVPNGKEVPIPAGTYTPASIQYFAPGAGTAKAGMWSIKCTAGFGKLATIPVQDGATTTVEAGPPFTLRASISPRQTPQGTVVSIGLAITGKAGEQYSAATIMKGASISPAPQVRILDEKGAPLAQGTMEYG